MRWAALATTLPSAALASAITVQPVTVQMEAGQAAASITLVNAGIEPVTYQARVFSWSQAMGGDLLTPNEGVIVSPPIATLPPGRSQLVRLVLRQPSTSGEEAWRLWIDEIPSPTQAHGVRVTLRLSIPIFHETSRFSHPGLVWSLERDGGASFLVARNLGERHEKLSGLQMTPSDGKPIAVKPSGSSYVLAAATRRWPVEIPELSRAVTFRLTGTGDTGGINQVVGDRR